MRRSPIEQHVREKLGRGLVHARKLAHVALEVRPGAEEPCPGVLIVRDERQQVVVLTRPGNVRGSNGVNVFARRAVLEMVFVTVMLVEVRDQIIHLLEVPEGVHVAEIATHDDEYLLGAVDFSAPLNLAEEVHRLLFTVEETNVRIDEACMP